MQNGGYQIDGFARRMGNGTVDSLNGEYDVLIRPDAEGRYADIKARTFNRIPKLQNSTLDSAQPVEGQASFAVLDLMRISVPLGYRLDINNLRYADGSTIKYFVNFCYEEFQDSGLEALFLLGRRATRQGAPSGPITAESDHDFCAVIADAALQEAQTAGTLWTPFSHRLDESRRKFGLGPIIPGVYRASEFREQIRREAPFAIKAAAGALVCYRIGGLFEPEQRGA